MHLIVSTYDAGIDQSNRPPIYLVVDPNYKEKFQLSGDHTAEYRALLAALPDVFVGGGWKHCVISTSKSS